MFNCKSTAGQTLIMFIRGFTNGFFFCLHWRCRGTPYSWKCLACKGSTETKIRRSNGQHYGPTVKPQVYRSVTARCVLASFYIGLNFFNLFMSLGHEKMCFRCFEGCREAFFLSKQFCWHPVLPELAPPDCHVLCPDGPVVHLCFLCNRYQACTGLVKRVCILCNSRGEDHPLFCNWNRGNALREKRSKIK